MVRRFALSLVFLSACVNFTRVKQHCPMEGRAECNDTIDVIGGNNTKPCVAKTCADLGAGFCGSADDGCEGLVSCACTAPEVCGAGGVVDRCSPQSSLAVAIDDGTSARVRGLPIVYTVTVTNLLAIPATTSLLFTLPASATLDAWSCPSATPASGNATTLPVIGVAPNGMTTCTVTVTPSAGSASPLVVTVALQGTLPSDPIAADDTATDTNTLADQGNDLAVAVSDGQSGVGLLESTTYTVSITNAGAVSTSGAVVATNALTVLQAITWTCLGTGGATCGTASGSGDPTAMVTVPPGGAIALGITGAPQISVANPFTFTASVTNGSTPDTNSANNSASDVNNVLAPAITTVALQSGTGVAVRQGFGSVNFVLTGTHLAAVSAVAINPMTPMSGAAYVTGILVSDPQTIVVTVYVGHGVSYGNYALSATHPLGMVNVANALAVSRIIVDPAGNDGTGRGVPLAPFRSLTHALTLASGYDTIYLNPGTYSAAATGEVWPTCAAYPCATAGNVLGDISITSNPAEPAIISGSGVCGNNEVGLIMRGGDPNVRNLGVSYVHFRYLRAAIYVAGSPNTGNWPVYTIDHVAFESSLCLYGLVSDDFALGTVSSSSFATLSLGGGAGIFVNNAGVAADSDLQVSGSASASTTFAGLQTAIDLRGRVRALVSGAVGFSGGQTAISATNKTCDTSSDPCLILSGASFNALTGNAIITAAPTRIDACTFQTTSQPSFIYQTDGSAPPAGPIDFDAGGSASVFLFGAQTCASVQALYDARTPAANVRNIWRTGVIACEEPPGTGTLKQYMGPTGPTDGSVRPYWNLTNNWKASPHHAVTVP
ncbi:MAG: DUF1565 domain-containing protein [Deltaproteobacteria bacterium]|nr:DUF1565 domain-containing protein [Deltaproteobacteria bacterium]